MDLLAIGDLRCALFAAGWVSCPLLVLWDFNDFFLDEHERRLPQNSRFVAALLMGARSLPKRRRRTSGARFAGKK
jgi:hypothetical protein